MNQGDRSFGGNYQYGRNTACKICLDCPPHPSMDFNWIAEMEERDGTAFYEESLRQFAEDIRRIANE